MKRVYRFLRIKGIIKEMGQESGNVRIIGIVVIPFMLCKLSLVPDIKLAHQCLLMVRLIDVLDECLLTPLAPCRG